MLVNVNTKDRNEKKTISPLLSRFCFVQITSIPREKKSSFTKCYLYIFFQNYEHKKKIARVALNFFC